MKAYAQEVITLGGNPSAVNAALETAIQNVLKASTVAQINTAKQNGMNTIEDLTPIIYTAVDLGLPSGLKWASANVGAENPQDAGLYFAWGETEGYAVDAGHDFSWANYKWSVDGSSSNFSKYNSTAATLDLEDDAARANMGGSWRMPTKEDFEELKNNTNFYSTINYEGTGKAGYILVSKANGNKIFLPAARFISGTSLDIFGDSGWYWSSSFLYTYQAYAADFDSNFFTIRTGGRRIGYSVRGVCE